MYLSVFRPELAKPTRTEVKKIVATLAGNKKVVEIPGYSNFYDFSHDWQDVIQAKLDDWQRVDGFIKQEWIRGLSGSNKVSSTELKTRMDEILDETHNKHKIVWVMLQLAGIESHAWLIVDVNVHQTGNYEISYIDSVYAYEAKTNIYHPGDTSLFMAFGTTVPYLGRQEDFARFAKATANYCSGRVDGRPMADTPELEREIHLQK